MIRSREMYYHQSPEKRVALHQVGVIHEDLDNIIKEATEFVAACYEMKKLLFHQTCLMSVEKFGQEG